MSLKGEIFLAWRYLKPQKTLISLLTYISLLGPILGVGILIVVISVMNGVPRVLEEKLISYNAHISISDQKSLSQVSEKISYLEKNYPLKSAPVIITPVLVETTDGNNALLITKGISPQHDQYVSQLKNMLIEGNFFINPKQIIVSKYLTAQLNIKIGDKLILHSPEKYKKQLEEGNFAESENSATEFSVAAIFETGVPEIDKNFLVSHIDDTSKLLSLPADHATQIEIAINNPRQAIEFAETLAKDPQLSHFTFTPWQYQHDVSQIYSWINNQKAMMSFVLFFIVIGSAIGVAACLFSLVIQKTKEIGILKATGVAPSSIINIFLIMGFALGALGAVLGFAGACVTIVFRQQITEIFGLWDKELYKLEKIPVFFDFSDISVTLFLTILICITASTVPAIIAAAVKPVKALQSKG